MRIRHQSGPGRKGVFAAVAATVLLGAASLASAETFTTTTFAGKAVNGGTATYDGEKRTLTWSDDFKVPGSPAPHWQVVDSKGNVYLLQRLEVEAGLLQRVGVKRAKQNRTIIVPAYVPDIGKVQIWCAWAEVLLGEATFKSPVVAVR
jgi:hypothetical protein